MYLVSIYMGKKVCEFQHNTVPQLIFKLVWDLQIYVINKWRNRRALRF